MPGTTTTRNRALVRLRADMGESYAVVLVKERVGGVVHSVVAVNIRQC